MTASLLQGRRILVVEDEFMIADGVRRALASAGATVLGPIGNLDDALALIQSEPHIDGALLDANLVGVYAYPAADLLLSRGVKIVFVTGYDLADIPHRFSVVPRCQKPFSAKRILNVISTALHTS